MSRHYTQVEYPKILKQVQDDNKTGGPRRGAPMRGVIARVIWGWRGAGSVLGLAIFIFLFSPVAIFAQQVALSISPPLLEVTIKPGKSVLIGYTLMNTGDPMILKAKVLPFEPRGTSGSITVKKEFEGPIQFSLENADLKLEQPYFLKTREGQQLLLRIRAPEGAPEGDYYYTFLNETQPPPTQEGISSSRAQATIGANILVTVTKSGNVDLKGKIAIFDVLKSRLSTLFGKRIKLYDSNDRIPLSLVLQNNGRNFVKPEGEITLKGNFGERARYTILPQNVLSQSQRTLTATPSAVLDCTDAEDEELCKTPHTLLLKGFFIGNYKLSANVNFGEGTPMLYASTSFIALPLKFLLGLFIAVIATVFVIRRFKSSE